MTRTLANRITGLERIHRVARASAVTCDVCGYAGVRATSFSVCFDGDGDDTPEFCPGCGRRQCFKIEFDDRG